MKPKARPAEPYRWTYDFIVPLTLYLDDLRDAFSLLQQVGPVVAETDAHIDITSFDDLRQLEGNPLTDLRMVATAAEGETATAHFRPNGASITITSGRPEFVGVLHQLQMVAFRHWRSFSIADTGMIFALGTVGLGATAATTALAPLPWNLALGSAIAAIGGLLFIIARRERRTRWTLMPMIWYANRPASFLKRNRDQIIVSLIFMVLGVLLGVWAASIPTR